MDRAVLDVQWFKTAKNQYIIKEISFIKFNYDELLKKNLRNVSYYSEIFGDDEARLLMLRIEKHCTICKKEFNMIDKPVYYETEEKKRKFDLCNKCFNVLYPKRKFNVNHYLLLPPFNFEQLSRDQQKQALWVKTNIHGFSWSDGLEQYNKLYEIYFELSQQCNTIYVKGSEKKQFLNNIFTRPGCMKIINIDDLGGSNLVELKEKLKDNLDDCSFPHNIEYCTKRNVQIYLEFIIKYWHSSCDCNNYHFLCPLVTKLECSICNKNF